MAPEVIHSRSNALVRRLRMLRQRGEKGGEGPVLLEGVKLVREGLASGIEILEVVAAPQVETRREWRSLASDLAARGIAVRWLHQDVLATVSEVEASQGVLALAARPAFDEASLFGENALIVVAVGIQNPGNLGALLRTAEAAGATGAYLTAGTADPFSWKALRGSMGSAFRLPHARRLSVDSMFDRLQSRGIRTVASALDGETPYDQADLTQPVALLLGNEGAGLAASITARAAVRVVIPTQGGVESLNVGVAAGLLLFEAARQRRRVAQQLPSRAGA